MRYQGVLMKNGTHCIEWFYNFS